MNMTAYLKQRAADMETVETLLGRKGRFVGDMVHISIADLAECINKAKDKDRADRSMG